MSSKSIRVAGFLSAGSLCLLSACSSVTSIKDVTADQVGYMSKNFSSQALSPSLAKKIPSDGRTTKFGKLVITSEVNSEQSDGKKDSWKSMVTMVDGGNGLV